ncbi:MAG: hypothetical protein ACI9OJ_002600 [Myxococcota bacterium]|jgi:hypothetical protein
MAIAVSGVSLWVALSPAVPTPEKADWLAAGRAVSERFETGDVLRFDPFWLDPPIALFEPFGGQPPPVFRGLPADEIINPSYTRVWVLTAFDRDAPRAPAGAGLVEELPLGAGLTLRGWTLPPSPVKRDLLADLDSAVVERWAPGQPGKRRCHWRNDRHDCKGRHWETVELSTQHVGGAPRRCMVLHPYPNHGTVGVTWRNVELGSAILIRSGFTLEAARNEKGSAVKLRVFVDNQLVLDRIEPPHAWHFDSSDIGTETGTTADVRIEATAEDERFRDLCVEAFVLER